MKNYFLFFCIIALFSACSSRPSESQVSRAVSSCIGKGEQTLRVNSITVTYDKETQSNAVKFIYAWFEGEVEFTSNSDKYKSGEKYNIMGEVQFAKDGSNDWTPFGDCSFSKMDKTN